MILQMQMWTICEQKKLSLQHNICNHLCKQHLNWYKPVCANKICFLANWRQWLNDGGDSLDEDVKTFETDQLSFEIICRVRVSNIETSLWLLFSIFSHNLRRALYNARLGLGLMRKNYIHSTKYKFTDYILYCPCTSSNSSPN